ncbi:MAG: lipocalin family protein [Bacteroidetes bacterium]|nr:lipocalin family protein [Bacteroidota bacterium]
MNKLKSISILVVFIFGITSCSSDSSSKQSAALAGKWQYSQTGTLVDNEEVLTDYEHSAGCTKDYIEILSTNVIKSHEYDTDCSETLKTGTISRSNNTVSITYPGEPAFSGEILELTATKLKVKFVSEDVTDIEVMTRIP